MTPSFNLKGLKDYLNQTRKLKTDILFESFTILSLSILLIISYTYHNNSLVIVNQAYEHIETSTTVLKNDILDALKDAESVVKIYNPLLKEVDLDKMNENIPFINSMSQILSIYPHLTTVYFGTPQGMFWELSSPQTYSSYIANLGLKLPEDATGVIKVINNEPKELRESRAFEEQSVEFPDQMSERARSERVQLDSPNEVNDAWYYIQDHKKLSAPHSGEKTGYDHRKRSWYTNSSKTQNVTWSDIYVFASTLKGEAGITASQALYDDQGRFKGVFSADITLKSFSEFLSKIVISKHAVSYVINEKNQVVANSALKPNVVVKADAYKLLTVSDLGDPVLEKALNLYQALESKKGSVLVNQNGLDYVAFFEDFPKLFDNDWKAVVICPLDDFVAQVKQNRNSTFLFSLIILLISSTLSYRLARRISKPIMMLANEATNIQNLEFDGKPALVPSRIREIIDLSHAINSLKTTIQSFSYYIPKSLVQKLVSKKQLIHVGGRTREISIMFTDIANFTNISETISADKLVVYLSEYFEELTKIIMDNEGTVDKYIGDSVMSFWGAPFPDRHHAFHACRSALLCQKRLCELNRVWKREGRPAFNTRIGVHLGDVIVGNIGSTERMNYTIIGDSVNLGSRLEGLNKFYGTGILVSDSIYTVVKDQFLCRLLDYVAVKGKKKAIKVYELVGQLKGDESLYPTDEQIQYCTTFEKAHNFYITRQWKEALKLFQSMDTPYHQNDLTIKLYIDRCEHYSQEPPPKDWDGSYVMTKK
jgi:adenylate cyclase